MGNSIGCSSNCPASFSPDAIHILIFLDIYFYSSLINYKLIKFSMSVLTQGTCSNSDCFVRVLFGVVRCCSVLFDVVRCCWMVVRCCSVLFDVVRYCSVLFGVVRCCWMVVRCCSVLLHVVRCCWMVVRCCSVLFDVVP